ncbi:trigger factor [Campylobacter sp. MIT 21-1685]|uniref:trigger factor n=1 Tax=unclassified Campylobacter TaxID=2593542 RepID=UPI00224B9C99|nr:MULTISPECIES: trigger factor [unclassified Campylobacter]MCX2683554.1 trigger factor [Campylobacter sp. MIT 21-1684]MCX2751851.1 trigger factor [Campylobacter sp. MIT 21-1682]MCX2808038.1 trigger factor [Campylobacter sp. MIT 21-1685]
MEVKAKQLDSVNASASIKISAEAIQTEKQKLAKKASKNVKIDGFRPGKVPVNAVIRLYGKGLQKDAEQNLFKNAIDTALKELNKESKELVGEPYFEKFDRQDENIIAECILSFKPQLNLQGYENLIPQYQNPKINKQELDEKRHKLLKNYAHTETIKEKRALQEGDFAQFDFEGFIDGKAFEGGKAENYVLEIGSKQFIPGFEEAMIGMNAGEQKEIQVRFPKEYGVANLADKEAVFKIKLHEIQQLKIPELDEEMLKKLLPNEEKPSKDLLEEKLKEQLYNEKLLKLINDELKPKFVQALIEKFDFDIPQGILEQEIDMQLRNSFKDLNQQEKEEVQTEKEKYEQKRESFKEEAKKSVKLTFIIDELAKLRKIDIKDSELVQAIYFEAYRYGVEPKQHLENYKKQGALPAVKMALTEEKLFNDIFMPKNDQNQKEEK